MDRLEQLQENRRGIIVSHREGGLDFGVVSLSRSKGGVVESINITASNPGLLFIRVGTYQAISSSETTP